MPHKPVKEKLVDRGAGQHHDFVRKTCDMITLAAECEYDEHKAVREDSEWVLNVVPHDGGPKHAGNIKTSGGIGGKPFQTKAHEDAEERKRETTHHHLEAEGDALKKRSAELAARRNQNTRNYQQTATRLVHDKGSYTLTRKVSGRTR